jgi:hypothetical protein
VRTEVPALTEGRAFWSIVKFDLSNERYAPAFHEVMNSHVRNLVGRDGFSHGWRTGELAHPGNVGEPDPSYWAIYEIDDLGRFAAMAARPSSGDPVEPSAEETAGRVEFDFRRDLIHWARPFYRVEAHIDGGSGRGRIFAREEYSVALAAEQAAFEARLADHHLPEMVAKRGFRAAWLLRHVASELQVGPDPVGTSMVIYEIDDPSSFTDTGRLGRGGSVNLPDGVAATCNAIHFSTVLVDVEASG